MKPIFKLISKMKELLLNYRNKSTFWIAKSKFIKIIYHKKHKIMTIWKYNSNSSYLILLVNFGLLLKILSKTEEKKRKEKIYIYIYLHL